MTATSAPCPTIYKIAHVRDWAAAVASGVFVGSEDDKRDGFIHFSTRDQLAGTLEKHFRNQTDLLLIAVSAADLGTELRWEPSRGGDLFPHLYAPLPTKFARWTRPLDLDANQIPITPEDLPAC